MAPEVEQALEVTTGRPGPARWRRRAALAGALVAMVVLAGCSTVLGTLHTETKIANAGFTNVSLTWHTVDGVTIVRVAADPTRRGQGLDGEARAVASIVWGNLPGQFDQLSVSIGALGTRTFTNASLQAMFGPRPDTLNQQVLNNGASADGALIAVLGLGALVAVIALIAYTVHRFRRQRRKAAAARTALLMSTIPQQFWGLAEGGQHLAGPPPPPPVPPPPPRSPSTQPGPAQQVPSGAPPSPVAGATPPPPVPPPPPRSPSTQPGPSPQTEPPPTGKVPPRPPARWPVSPPASDAGDRPVP